MRGEKLSVVNPYCWVKEVNETKLMTKTATVNSVSRKRVFRRLKLRLAREKTEIILSGRKRVKVREIMKEMPRDMKTPLRRVSVETRRHPGYVK